jgi:hypothetical protein
MKKSLIFISALVLSLTSAYAMTDADLQKAMRAEVAPHLFTIKKPRLFFHWVDASDLTPKGQYDLQLAPNSNQFVDYVTKESNKIVNKRSERDQDLAGPGMYLASDPLISRSYGGEKRYGLIVGKINTKARILPGSYELEFSSSLTSEFEARGCTMGPSVIAILDTADVNCTKIKQLLVGKDASFIDGRLYRWGSDADILPGCVYDSAGDAMIIGKNGASIAFETLVGYNKNLFSEIVGFTHRSSFTSGASLGNSVLSYLKTLDSRGIKNRFTKVNLLSDEQKNDSNIPLMNQTDLESFTKNNIYGCR